VLDIYWRWSQQGDTYLGRLLSGLDPNDVEFGMLPPHFKEGRGNDHISEAVRLCFRPIINMWADKCTIESSLILFLASMVWHSNLLVSFMTGSTGHPFQNIPILQNPTLLRELKQLVTCDPCNGVMMPSGVPWHIKNLKLLYSMLHQQEKTLEAIMNLTNSLPQIVCDAISQKAAESGHVTVEYVMDALDTSTNSIKALIETSVHDSICKAMKYHNVRTEGLMVVEAEEGQGVEWPIAAYREYTHADGFRCAVPPGFEFSSCSLRLAWNAWLVGFPGIRSATQWRGTGSSSRDGGGVGWGATQVPTRCASLCKRSGRRRRSRGANDVMEDKERSNIGEDGRRKELRRAAMWGVQTRCRCHHHSGRRLSHGRLLSSLKESGRSWLVGWLVGREPRGGRLVGWLVGWLDASKGGGLCMYFFASYLNVKKGKIECEIC
jgi:hypothetical protein